MQIDHYNASALGVDYSATHQASDGPAVDNFHNNKPHFSPGFRSCSAQGGEFVYVQFSAAMSEGEFAIVDSDGKAKALTTVSAGNETGTPVGVVAAKSVALNDYGWVQVYGKQAVRTITSVAKNATLYTTATAGVLTGTSATGVKTIDGVVLQAAAAGTGSPKTEAHLNYPVIGATV